MVEINRRLSYKATLFLKFIGMFHTDVYSIDPSHLLSWTFSLEFEDFSFQDELEPDNIRGIRVRSYFLGFSSETTSKTSFKGINPPILLRSKSYNIISNYISRTVHLCRWQNQGLDHYQGICSIYGTFRI